MEYAPATRDHADKDGLKRSVPSRRIKPIQIPNAIFIIAGSIVLIRSWIDDVHSYISLSLYTQGKERMPYQGRFPMMLPMRWAEGSNWVRRLCNHFNSGNLSDPKYMAIFLISVPAFLISTYCITSIYRSFSKTGGLAWLVPWVCIYAAQSTYVVRYEQSWMYPYDFTALAFFAAGLWAIRRRRFFFFSIVFLVGTLNRETMLLLLPVLAMELFYGVSETRPMLTHIAASALFTILLATLWLGIRLLIMHHFHGVRSEENSHLQNNIQVLRHIQDWPELASTCGFLWFIPICFWSKIDDLRLRMYIVALMFPWVCVMFVYGMIAEARIYGELIVLLVPTAVVLFEESGLVSVPH